MECSNYAQKKTASDNLKKYGVDSASIFKQNIYFDNMVKIFSSIEEAIKITGKVKELLTFNL